MLYVNYDDKQTPLQKQIGFNDNVIWIERIIDDLPDYQKMTIQ